MTFKVTKASDVACCYSYTSGKDKTISFFNIIAHFVLLVLHYLVQHTIC